VIACDHDQRRKPVGGGKAKPELSRDDEGFA
jgi:hypothetical protein